MRSQCSCSGNSSENPIVRLSPRNEETISLPHVFRWAPLDNAHNYVLVISEIRGKQAVCIKETQEPRSVLEAADVAVNRNYLWHLEAMDEEGQTIATTQGPCGTEINTFAVPNSDKQGNAPHGRRVLLDFSHRQSDIRGLGVYNFSQHTVYTLLQNSGFEVGKNADRKLSTAMLDGYDMLILHGKYAGSLIPFIPSEVAAVTDYVSGGGNLFVLCWGSGGGVDMDELYNPLLKEFDIELKPMPEPQFRKAEHLAVEIFQGITEIALQCPAEILGNGYDVLAGSVTGNPLLIRRNYGNGTVWVSAMGMAFQDAYMAGTSEGAANNRNAFTALMTHVFGNG